MPNGKLGDAALVVGAELLVVVTTTAAVVVVVVDVIEVVEELLPSAGAGMVLFKPGSVVVVLAVLGSVIVALA